MQWRFGGVVSAHLEVPPKGKEDVMTQPTTAKWFARALLLGTTATFVFAIAPVDPVQFDLSFAMAAGRQSQGDQSGGDNGGGGGREESRGGSDSRGAGESAGSGGSSDRGGSDRDSSDRGGSGRGEDNESSRGKASKGAVAKSVPAAPVYTAPSKGSAAKGSSSAGGSSGAPVRAGKPTVSPSGDDSDSDRPEWAGVPGGPTSGGGAPDNAGDMKGDLFGDLWVIARDDNGVPILSPEGWVQPLDEFGNLIPLDEEGHPVDESLTIEVELGRLNVGRAPTHVLLTRADEVVSVLNNATDLTTDATGRLVFTIDGVQKTIDSPLENLAIYVALMTTGTIAGVSDLPGTEFDFMVDGTLTVDDLAASTTFLAAATDKTGVFTTDEIAYINAFLGVETETVGSVTYSDIDFSAFTYDRMDTYGDISAEVLVLEDGIWVPTTVNIFDAVFGNAPLLADGTLEAYTIAADDARMVINFLHEYEVPAESLEDVTH